MTHQGAAPIIKPTADGWPRFQLLRHRHKKVPPWPVTHSACLCCVCVCLCVCVWVKALINLCLRAVVKIKVSAVTDVKTQTWSYRLSGSDAVSGFGEDENMRGLFFLFFAFGILLGESILVQISGCDAMKNSH